MYAVAALPQGLRAGAHVIRVRRGRAQRAYRPDNDLLATLHSNHGELACLEQKWDAADEHHTKVSIRSGRSGRCEAGGDG